MIQEQIILDMLEMDAEDSEFIRGNSEIEEVEEFLALLGLQARSFDSTRQMHLERALAKVRRTREKMVRV